jgi:hypothetical protein
LIPKRARCNNCPASSPRLGRLRELRQEVVIAAQRKRIGSAPGDPALGVDSFEVANQQQSETDPGGKLGRPIVAA